MIRTIIYFGLGGFFTSCVANGVRRIPVFKTPSLHLTTTAIGLMVGYRAHIFEKSADDRFREMTKTHEGVPLYNFLLAEGQSKPQTEKESVGEEELDEE